jgi:hypothetical protein
LAFAFVSSPAAHILALERGIAIVADREQTVAIFGERKDKDGLRPADKLARRTAFVNDPIVLAR